MEVAVETGAKRESVCTEEMLVEAIREWSMLPWSLRPVGRGQMVTVYPLYVNVALDKETE